MADSRAAALLDFVGRYVAAGREAPTLDTPLISEGILDSMGILLLATFIEEELGVPFDGSKEMRAGRCETLREVLARIDRG